MAWAIVEWEGKPTRPQHPDVVDMYVRPGCRKRGIGTALLRHIEDLAATRGVTMIGLSVNPERNPEAKRLYERLGYRHDGSPTYLDGVYEGNEDWVIDLVKPLGAHS